MAAEKSSWSQAGININLSQASFNTVTGIAVPCTVVFVAAGELGRGLDLLPGRLPDR